MTRYTFRECYCHTCCKSLHSLGVARHRAMHRDRKELCTIMYADGQTYEHDFRPKAKT